MSNSNPNSIGTDTLFTWTIKNFDMCHFEYLTSPEFSHCVGEKAKFYMKLYPRGISSDYRDYLSVFIVKSTYSKKGDDTNYTGELGIVTMSEKRCLLKFNEPLGLLAKGLRKFLNRASLSQTDGDLTLYCSLFSEGSLKRQQTSSNAELLKLSRDFGKAYEEGLLTDMSLQTKGETLRVHRAMVGTRIPLLANTQDGDWSNIEGNTADAFMRYIYSGRLNTNDMPFQNIVKSPFLSSHMKSLLCLSGRDIKSETIISKKHVSFKWEVKHFRTLTSDDVLRYSMTESDIQTWTWLTLCLTVLSSEPSDDDKILFSVTRYFKECKRIVCRISALDMCKTFDHTFGEEDCWNIPAFARRCEVVGEGSDDASFLFEVSLTDGKSTSCVNSIDLSACTSLSPDTFDDLESFRDDLETMLQRRTHHDFDLITLSKTLNEHRFPCHRFVLAARCQGFREMLKTSETPHEISIVDVEPASVEYMLSYLYLGYIDDFPATQTLELYELANRYGIPGLKEESVRQIKLSLSVETIGDVLSAADKWNDTQLKECVFNFVCTFPRLFLNSSRLQKVLESRNDLALDMLNSTLACLARGSKEIEKPD